MKRLLLLLPLLWLGACASLSLQKPTVKLADIKPAGLSLVEQAFDVSLRVSNPNAFALSGRGMQFKLFLGGQPLADGLSNQPFEIPARGSAVVTVRLHTALSDWLKQAGSLLAHPNRGLNYRLEGRIDRVNGLADLPFTSEGSWSLAGKGAGS